MTARCLANSYTCDKTNDCTDWADENEEKCPHSDDEYRCYAIVGTSDSRMPTEKCKMLQYRHNFGRANNDDGNKHNNNECIVNLSRGSSRNVGR